MGLVWVRVWVWFGFGFGFGFGLGLGLGLGLACATTRRRSSSSALMPQAAGIVRAMRAPPPLLNTPPLPSVKTAPAPEPTAVAGYCAGTPALRLSVRECTWNCAPR